MTRRRHAPHYRSLRLERSEDRCLFSAASVVSPDLVVEEAPKYLSNVASGWVVIDSDSRMPSFDFSSTDTKQSDSATRDFTLGDFEFSGSLVVDVENSFSLTLGSLNATAQAYRDEAGSLRLTLDDSADRGALTLTWANAQQGVAVTRALRVEFGDQLATVDPGLFETVLNGLPNEGVALQGNGSVLADVVQRWLGENQAFLENNGSHPAGWLPDVSETSLIGGGDSTGSDVDSWIDMGSETGPASPTLDDTFTRSEDGYDDGPTYTLSEGEDIPAGSRLLAKLREWFRDETVRAATESLDESESRSRTASTPLERVAETPAPEAGEESPGAGMIDLAALLLPASGSDKAPSVALAAASRAADGDGTVSAHDAALAVESWVRTLPVPAEVIGVVEGAAPSVRESAIDVRKEGPVKQVLPQPQAARDHVSAASETTAQEGPQTLARGPQAPAERLDERQATSGSGYVAAWLTTLLGGAVVWANRRGVRHRASDCIETPRRDLRQGGQIES